MPDFRLLVMRHGQAESYSADGDAGRRLTADGLARIRHAAIAMDRIITINRAVVSPFVRAQQTAEVICGPHNIELQTSTELTPGTPAEISIACILRHAEGLPEGGVLGVFGHNPNLTSVLSLLVAGRSDAYFNVRPGSCALLTVPEFMPFRPAGAEGPQAILDTFLPLETLVALSHLSED